MLLNRVYFFTHTAHSPTRKSTWPGEQQPQKLHLQGNDWRLSNWDVWPH